MVKNLVKLSIVFFFVLAAFFFMLIFLLGDAEQTKMDNQIKQEVPIQQARVRAWGEVPGTFDFAYTREVDFYAIDDAASTASELALSQQSSVKMEVTREFLDPAGGSGRPQWTPQKSVVEYRQQYSYAYPGTASEEDAQPNADLRTLNFGA
jgi:hypothetical protein